MIKIKLFPPFRKQIGMQYKKLVTSIKLKKEQWFVLIIVLQKDLLEGQYVVLQIWKNL